MRLSDSNLVLVTQCQYEYLYNIRIMKSILFRNLVLLIIVMLRGRVRRQYKILVWSGSRAGGRVQSCS